MHLTHLDATLQAQDEAFGWWLEHMEYESYMKHGRQMGRLTKTNELVYRNSLNEHGRV